MVVQTPAKLV